MEKMIMRYEKGERVVVMCYGNEKPHGKVVAIYKTDIGVYYDVLLDKGNKVVYNRSKYDMILESAYEEMENS
jgi:hypothetical protein